VYFSDEKSTTHIDTEKVAVWNMTSSTTSIRLKQKPCSECCFETSESFSTKAYIGLRFRAIHLAVLNKSISQRWRRLRRRCSSFTTPSAGGERLVPQTQETNMPREESTPLRTTAGEILRSKLNRLHAGLRKRRAVSVHEMSRNQPTFYVPSPLTRDTTSLPPYNYRSNDNHGKSVCDEFPPRTVSVDSRNGERDKIDYDSYGNCDENSRCRRKSSSSPPPDAGYHSIETERRSRRWSVADAVKEEEPCFMIGGRVTPQQKQLTPADSGPTSLPYSLQEEEEDEMRGKQRDLIRQLQEALEEKKNKKKYVGVLRTHRSSGDLVPQHQELSLRTGKPK
ncbi:hypothetical protein L9F63_024374, partial [Diploptera punctata]